MAFEVRHWVKKWCERHYEDPDGRRTILPAIIQPKNPSARNCIVPPCQSCLLACTKKRSPNVSRTQPLEDREGAITRTNKKLVILSLQTSSSVRRPEVCRPGMDGNHKTAVFRAAPYIMMQHQAWFGLKTKSLLVPMKRSWVQHVSNNGCGINVSPKSNIIMVIMVFSLLRNTIVIVTRKD